MDIDKIILKVLNRKASAEEYEILEEWKNESEANLMYLDTLNIEGVHYTHFDKQSAWENVNRRISKTTLNPWYILLAVVIAIAITIGYHTIYKSEKYPVRHQAIEHMAAVDLNDNSKIYLKEGSELLQLSDFQSERKVIVNGEAFFEVAHDPVKPFIIELSAKDFIRVIGTSFNLVHTDEIFDLVVYSGSVELHTLDRKILLEKGDRVSRFDEAYVKLRNNDPNLVSWKTGVLEFRNTDLIDVLNDIESHYGITWKEADEVQRGACSLTARFQGASIEEVLVELEKIFNMEYRFENNTLEIVDLNCD